MPLLERIQFFDTERPFPHHPWLNNQSISTRLSKDHWRGLIHINQFQDAADQHESLPPQ
jgi:hypothetical protein